MASTNDRIDLTRENCSIRYPGRAPKFFDDSWPAKVVSLQPWHDNNHCDAEVDSTMQNLNAFDKARVWLMVGLDDGRKFWYHSAQRKSMWYRPDELLPQEVRGMDWQVYVQTGAEEVWYDKRHKLLKRNPLALPQQRASLQAEDVTEEAFLRAVSEAGLSHGYSHEQLRQAYPALYKHQFKPFEGMTTEELAILVLSDLDSFLSPNSRFIDIRANLLHAVCIAWDGDENVLPPHLKTLFLACSSRLSWDPTKPINNSPGVQDHTRHAKAVQWSYAKEVVWSFTKGDEDDLPRRLTRGQHRTMRAYSKNLSAALDFCRKHDNGSGIANAIETLRLFFPEINASNSMPQPLRIPRGRGNEEIIHPTRCFTTEEFKTISQRISGVINEVEDYSTDDVDSIALDSLEIRDSQSAEGRIREFLNGLYITVKDLREMNIFSHSQPMPRNRPTPRNQNDIPPPTSLPQPQHPQFSIPQIPPPQFSMPNPSTYSQLFPMLPFNGGSISNLPIRTKPANGGLVKRLAEDGDEEGLDHSGIPSAKARRPQ